MDRCPEQTWNEGTHLGTRDDNAGRGDQHNAVRRMDDTDEDRCEASHGDRDPGYDATREPAELRAVRLRFGRLQHPLPIGLAGIIIAVSIVIDRAGHHTDQTRRCGWTSAVPTGQG